MIAVDIALGLCGLVALLATIRILLGPDRGSRIVGAELLTVAVVAMIALGGTRTASTSTFDIVLIATMVAFLATVSLSRALTGGAR